MTQLTPKYNFKIAEESDLPDIVRMCKDFFASSSYSKDLEMDENRLIEYVHWYITAPKNTAIVVLLTYGDEVVGMLAMLSSLMPFRYEYLAYEQVWWVDPEHRKGRVALKMLSLVEEWAKKVGCTMVSLTALESETVSRLYRARGYRLAEQAFVKRI